MAPPNEAPSSTGDNSNSGVVITTWRLGSRPQINLNNPGSGPHGLVLINDPVFPIAQFSLLRLGFTHAEALQIQSLVVVEGFDPDSAVWVQKMINKGTHRTVAKNIMRFVNAGWEMEAATEYLKQPEAQGWILNGRDPIPPPLAAVRMINSGWQLQDAVRWLVKRRGVMGDEMPLPPTAQVLLNVGWTEKEAVAWLFSWNGRLPSALPLPRHIQRMVDAGWPASDAAEYYEDVRGEIGAVIPPPSTRASRAEECERQKKLEDERMAVAVLQNLIDEEFADRIPAFFRGDAEGLEQQPPIQPTISPEAYRNIIHTTFINLEATEERWRHARGGAPADWDRNNDGLAAELVAMRQDVQGVVGSEAEDSDASVMEVQGSILQQLVNMSARMNGEINKIEQREKTAAEEAAAQEEKAAWARGKKMSKWCRG